MIKWCKLSTERYVDRLLLAKQSVYTQNVIDYWLCFPISILDDYGIWYVFHLYRIVLHRTTFPSIWIMLNKSKMVCLATQSDLSFCNRINPFTQTTKNKERGSSIDSYTTHLYHIKFTITILCVLCFSYCLFQSI